MTLVLIDVDGTLLTRKNSEFVFGFDLLRHGILWQSLPKFYVFLFLVWQSAIYFL